MGERNTNGNKLFLKKMLFVIKVRFAGVGRGAVNPSAAPAYQPKLIGVARGVATLTYEEATPFKRYYKYIILTLSFGGNMGGQASIWGGLATPDHSLSLSRRDWFVTFKVIEKSLHFHMLNLSAGQAFI